LLAKLFNFEISGLTDMFLIKMVTNVKVQRKTLDYLAISKMNYHPMFHHPGIFPSQVVLLQVVLYIFGPNTIFLPRGFDV